MYQPVSGYTRVLFSPPPSPYGLRVRGWHGVSRVGCPTCVTQNTHVALFATLQLSIELGSHAWTRMRHVVSAARSCRLSERLHVLLMAFICGPSTHDCHLVPHVSRLLRAASR